MKLNNVNLVTIVTSIVVVGIIAISLIAAPDATLNVINTVFGFVSSVFGTPLLWFSLICTALCVFLAASKYGKVRLGDGNADYSLFSYISMMICAGLASASVYFSFTEWIFFYSGPALGIEPMSTLAAEYAPAYSFTYWGLISWPPFVIAAIPMALAYYKRKNKSLRLSAVCEDLFNLKEKSLAGKVIDILFAITTLGGLSVTLGLGIPLISFLISTIFGIQDSFGLQVGIVIAITAIFTITSYAGLSKGMQKLSTINIYIAIVFVLALFVLGPTLFIMKYITNGVSLAVQEYFNILLWTDPVNNGGFSEAWIIFYICFAVAYAPLMSLFITKISKGRSLREMILSAVLGGTFGCIILFGINGGFGMEAQLTGKLDIVSLFNESGTGPTIMAVLGLLPFNEIISIAVLAVMMILFLATSMDSASFSLAATSSKNVGREEEPSKMLRLFWCLLLALIPLGLMFAGAPLSAIQTICLVTATPFAVIILVFIFKSMKWLKEESAILEDAEELKLLEKIKNK